MLSAFSLRSANLWGPKENETNEGVGSLWFGYGKLVSIIHFMFL